MHMMNNIKSAPQMVILCGAGASVAEPAGLPSVNRFIKELKEACHRKTDIDKITISKALNGVKGDKAKKPPRFEQVIACISEFDPQLCCLSYLKVDISDGNTQPNALHRYLAELLHHGTTVLTTNFDALIELAYWIVYGKLADTAKGHLLKLHGSVQEIRNGTLLDTEREQVKADIYAVASGTPIDGSNGSMSEIMSLIRGKDLLVFGYSFSDAFDVTPALIRSEPRSATIVEYQYRSFSSDLDEVESFVDLPNFMEIEEVWREKGVSLHFLSGDPIALTPTHLAASIRTAASSKPILPIYEKDQLKYLLARLLQIQDVFHLSNPIFGKLARDASDGEIRARAAYFFVRTLPDWDNVVAYESELLAQNASAEVTLRSLILLLDARSFIGPGKAFMSTYVLFKKTLAIIDGSDKERTLNLGKAYHCFANYLMNCGRPSWAYKFALVSLSLRIRYGEPTDIFNAEFACCLALGLCGDFEKVGRRLKSLRKYSEKIQDDSSLICVSIVEGIYLLGTGSPTDAVEKFEQARFLYTADGQDETQVDPELELYLLEARVHYQGWTSSNLEHLHSIKRYVEDHSYTYYLPVVDALTNVSAGTNNIWKTNRLTKFHLNRIQINFFKY